MDMDGDMDIKRTANKQANQGAMCGFVNQLPAEIFHSFQTFSRTHLWESAIGSLQNTALPLK